MSKRKIPSIYQLKITLKDIKPPIWRRLQVQSDTPLTKLHEIIQVAMGWEDYHLHQFIIDGVYYGVPDPDFGIDDMVDEKGVTLNALIKQEKDKLIYEYDFGDGWLHTILLEKILEPGPRTTYPRCIKGKRGCPPEDVGGPWSYGEFLESIRDEDDPEHDSNLEWAGEGFDPEAFDMNSVNESLKKIR